MKIVIVEDDHFQMDLVDSEIRNSFPKAVMNIIRVNTEQEFVSRLNEFVKNPPDLFVIDMLLRWTDPSPNMPAPPTDVKESGFFRAGLRCAQRLAENKSTNQVPIIIQTVLEQDDVADDLQKIPSARYLRKDGGVDSLIQMIQEIRKLSV